jgi:hypothetical protein
LKINGWLATENGGRQKIRRRDAFKQHSDTADRLSMDQLYEPKLLMKIKVPTILLS